MPMPALTLNNGPIGKPIGTPLPYGEGKKENVKRGNIGSFRSNKDLKSLLPADIYSALFEPVPDDLDIRSLITLPRNQGKHHLNNAAFGRAYDEVLALSGKLRHFAETDPDTFYDQACLPLIDHTYSVLEQFFCTEQLVLVPNCSFGLRAVVERLVRARRHRVMAQLAPLYGATQKLLEFYRTQGQVDKVLKISPGRGDSALLEEDPGIIVEALEDAYAMQEFSVLFCDQVASQTGRILPLEAVSRFCQENNIVLVVDGTQSCQLFFGKNKKQILAADYFVMSTHKWLSNVKTCGLVLYRDPQQPPLPPAISFGWEPARGSMKSSVESTRSMFQWQGMLDSYIPYITLARAVKIFSKYGEAQLMMASGVLSQGISDVLHRKPLLSKTVNSRVINILELKSAQFESMGDITTIQNALQVDY